MTDEQYAADNGCTDVRCQGSCIHCGAGQDEPCFRTCEGPRDPGSEGGTR
jgi:hypothetical protein